MPYIETMNASSSLGEDMHRICDSWSEGPGSNPVPVLYVGSPYVIEVWIIISVQLCTHYVCIIVQHVYVVRSVCLL